jgi:predicted nucleic acid-binding protein
MRRLRIYLDTSVISSIDVPHLPAREAITKEFFRMMTERFDDYETIISPVSLDEIRNAPKTIRKRHYAVLQSIQTVEVPKQREAESLSHLYVEAGVLSNKHRNDLRHLAYAVASRCNYIVSWNMRHLVRVHTMERVNAVNFEYLYPAIMIVTPEHFTGEFDHA